MYKGYSIIDVHVHIYKDKIAQKASDVIGEFYHRPMDENGSVASVLSTAQGVDRFVVHSAATAVRQVHSINEFICEQMAAHPEFIGLGTLHPLMENMEAEVDWMIEHGLRGVKLHPDFQEFDLDSPEALRIYRLIAGRLPLLLHMGDHERPHSKPEMLARLLDKGGMDGLTLIAAHFGGYSVWEESKKHLLGKYDIYMDTSSSLLFLEPDEAADMIRTQGVERMLFGTDYPMWNFEKEFERFMKIPLTEEERRAVLGENAAKLFGVEL